MYFQSSPLKSAYTFWAVIDKPSEQRAYKIVNLPTSGKKGQVVAVKIAEISDLKYFFKALK